MVDHGVMKDKAYTLPPLKIKEEGKEKNIVMFR